MEDSEKGALVAGILFVPMLVVITLVFTIWDGWVLSVLWRWFAVPIFHLPSITISTAIGIALICGLLTHQYQVDPKETASGQKLIRFLAPFIGGTIALIVGYIVRP